MNESPLQQKSSKACAYCRVSSGDAVLKDCSRCRLVAYCGKSCQGKHWKSGHKKTCIPRDIQRNADSMGTAVKACAEDPLTASSHAAMTIPPSWKRASGRKKSTVNELPECDNCGTGRDNLVRCGRCGLAKYCAKECQSQHWRKGGHKQFCLTPEQRRHPEVATVAPPPQTASTLMNDEGRHSECSICLGSIERPSETTKLACSHVFHATCVEKLREFGVAKVCPNCREGLLLRSDKLYDEGARRFFILHRQVEKWRQSWQALSPTQQQEMDSVKALLHDAANEGHASAQCMLGDMNLKGLGVEKNFKEAVRWCRLAAEQGDSIAQYNLGVMYARGQGVEKDFNEAVRWYRLAAEQGDAKAQYNLGVMYEHGLGVEKNFNEAVRWYRLAAEQGHATAQYNLGIMYELGQGVEKNFKEAVRWCSLAAEQGDAKAQYILGVMYEHGQGVEKKTMEAVRWYRFAAEQGFARAAARIIAIGRVD